MNGNGLIDNQIVFSGNENYDFFLFGSEGMFEPTLEELLSEEIRADWEDETDDNEEMEIGGIFILSEPEKEISSPQKLKIEISVNLNISINGESVSFQLGSNGLDTSTGEETINGSINQGKEKGSFMLSQNEFSKPVLRI